MRVYTAPVQPLSKSKKLQHWQRSLLLYGSIKSKWKEILSQLSELFSVRYTGVIEVGKCCHIKTLLMSTSCLQRDWCVLNSNDNSVIALLENAAIWNWEFKTISKFTANS